MSDDTEDLIAKARRGELDADGLRRLDARLARSVEARLLHRAGVELDAADRVLPGDDAVAERVARRVLASRRGPRRVRRPVLRFAVAFLATVGSALGAVAVLQQTGVVPSWPAAAPTAQLDSPGRHRVIPGARVPEPAAPVTPSSVPAPSAPVASAPVALAPVARPTAQPGSPVSRTVGSDRSPSVAPTHRPAASESPADVFARANSARQAGRTSDAIGLYRRLQAQFPSTAESQTADVLLGSLELSRGQPKAALAAFKRYLRRAPAGALSAEALWGQARALSALGREKESADVMRTLGQRFPGSPYAPSPDRTAHESGPLP